MKEFLKKKWINISVWILVVILCLLEPVESKWETTKLTDITVSQFFWMVFLLSFLVKSIKFKIVEQKSE